MTKKSKLLQATLLASEELARKNFHENTANYFLVSTLEFLKEYTNDKTNAFAEHPLIKAELDRVCDMLKIKDLDIDKIIKQISEDATDPLYLVEKDEYAFKRLIDAVDRANDGDDFELDMSDYIEEILNTPTEAIKSYILPFISNDEEQGDDSSVDNEDDYDGDDNDADENGKNDADTESVDERIERLRKKLEDLFGNLPPQEPPRKNPFFDDEDDDDEDDDDDEEEVEIPDSIDKIIEDCQRMQKNLLGKVFGQDHAVNMFVSGYFQSRVTAMAENITNKPKAIFLFAGPPGTGKTFLAENIAEQLGMPYKRFDMSAYTDNESAVSTFKGVNPSFKSASEGLVTGFVNKNPKSVILFDEIEKACPMILNLFLQILDEATLVDQFTQKTVSFANTTLIFTTNLGQNLYDSDKYSSLSAIPRKKILKALEVEINPRTQEPKFPKAICSRFAAGNVVMFNHLEGNNLLKLVEKELNRNAKNLKQSSDITINYDSNISSAVLYSVGGRADGRTAKGRANSFFFDELYELLRLVESEDSQSEVSSIDTVNVSVSLDNVNDEIKKLFVNDQKAEVLVFSNDENIVKISEKIDNIVCHKASTVSEAKDILFENNITMAIADIYCGIRGDDNVLNAEDLDSEGIDFVEYICEKYRIPTYIATTEAKKINEEELLSFAKMGVKDTIGFNWADFTSVEAQIKDRCESAYQEQKLFKLARENKALSYKTYQAISNDGAVTNIKLYDLCLTTITDLQDDDKGMLDNRSCPTVTFDRVIGANDAKEELKYYVEYLKNPTKYLKLGVAAPKGILLYGPPGTGKTLLAKALAGESGVTFFATEGNEFIKTYYGQGEKAIHDLFKAARKYAPAIIFIDEIDAIGKDRNTDDKGYISSYLTALLAEMDGFKTDTTKPIIVVAATNYGTENYRGKKLDAALLRRFDRQIYIDLPNKDERREFIKMRLNDHPNILISESLIENLCVRSTGMSLAELDLVFELAMRTAIRRGADKITDKIFDEAFETFNGGEEKKWNDDTLMRTARHEAGHALVCWLSGEKPSYLTIVSRGDHGGYMQHGDSEGKGTYTRGELRARIRTSLAGRAAELVYYGEECGLDTGASSDLRHATSVAKRMICNYGMDEKLGLAVIDIESDSPNYMVIRQRINEILSEELENAKALIAKNKDAIDAIVDKLMECNQLGEAEIDAIFKQKAVSDK